MSPTLTLRRREANPLFLATPQEKGEQSDRTVAHRGYPFVSRLLGDNPRTNHPALATRRMMNYRDFARQHEAEAAKEKPPWGEFFFFGGLAFLSSFIRAINGALCTKACFWLFVAGIVLTLLGVLCYRKAKAQVETE